MARDFYPMKHYNNNSAVQFKETEV